MLNTTIGCGVILARAPWVRLSQRGETMTHSYFRGGLAFAAALLISGRALAVDVDLGSVDRVTNLVSYPNCLTNCPSPQYPQTLTQTVSHYLNQSLARDGLTDSTVTVSQKGNHIIASFAGTAATLYPTALDNFLTDGDKAYLATLAIQKSGRWQPDWRFFLPWGLAMTQNPTMELLHFPPDYSLTSQDYLNSATTDRWANLLVVNGVGSTSTNAYQAIIDIAPIAAPSNAGTPITNANVYGDYYTYSGSLLSAWAVNSKGVGKPLVAFGSPVRDWVKTYMGLTLAVDQVGVGKLTNGVTVPVIASNHPSLIWYAAYNGSAENFSGGMSVMRQDLIAACWQANMGKDPTLDPNSTQQACTTQWTQDTYGVCMQLETTIYKKPVQQSVAVCGAGGALSSFVEPSPEELTKEEREFTARGEK